MKIHPLIIILFVFAFMQQLIAQDTSENLKELQKKLATIQKEIDKLENQLKAAESKLKSEAASIENIDRQITLLNEKIKLYRNEIGNKRRSIATLEVQIDSINQKIKSLRQLFKEQVVFAYKYRRGKHLDWLLGASNFNQALIRYRYFQKVAKAEKRTFNDLQELLLDLDVKEIKLSSEVRDLEELLASAQREENTLEDKRELKAQLVREINQNKKSLTRALDKKNESYNRIKNLIASLEKEKSERQLKPQAQIKWDKISGTFTKNKGKLNWPVAGNILHKFGRFRNPKLKTILNNTGIDIKATRGGSVRCIFPGVVSLITYMSGFGNTVIVDHNDSYYSVYAHLDQINVNQGQFIEDGSVIGTVGETGSLEGAKLHFEIYGNNKPLNPLTWLRKQ